MFGRKKKVTLTAPLPGRIVEMTEVPDPMFSEKMLGDGFAVDPPIGAFDVVAPCDGTLAKVFDSLHAFAMKSDEGLEILVHIGLETVERGGEGFTAHASTGDHVTAGQKIISVDGEVLSQAGFNLITPVVLTKPSQVASLKLSGEGATITLA